MLLLKTRLAPVRQARVLDVATGRGQFIQSLLECLNDFAEITGIDQSAKAIAAANSAFGDERIHFALMDCRQMEFASETFDIVAISNTLHHLAPNDLCAVLAEMKRVLKPGGLFVVNEMFQDNQDMSHVLFHHWSAGIDRLHGVYHHETFANAVIRDIVDGIGLEEVEFSEFNYQDVEADSEETLRQMVQAVDRLIESIKELPEYHASLSSGEELKGYLLKTGFRAATQLIAIGKKYRQ